MSRPIAIDIREWREVLDGVYCKKDDPQKIIFRCNLPDSKEKVKDAKKKLKEEKEESKQESS